MSANQNVIQNPQNIDVQLQRYSHMMQLLSLAMILSSIAIACLFITVNAQIEMIVFIISTLVIYLVLLFVFRAGYLKAGFYGLFYLAGLTGLISNATIGWRSGNFVLLFVLIPVLVYNPVIKRTEKIILGFVYCILLVSIILLGFLIIPTIRFNTFQLQIMSSFNVLMTCLIMAGISYLDFRNTNKVAASLIDLNHQLAYQASRDSLTNLLNRRTMNQLIQLEHVRSRRSGKPFGLVMADVDDFKQVNDEHGHAAGDLVLTELASLLSAALRKQDLTSRWGGEEFLILLPETDFEGVQIAAEKIRDLVSRSSFTCQGRLIRITLSIGSVVCQDQEDWDDCIKHADRALYYGKKHGKNLAIFSKGDHYCILGDLGETLNT